MWRKQEEEERERDEFDDYFEGSKTKTCLQYEESSLSWEEQAFAEDAGRLGACVWPPTSYSCSFCRRQFRSAQALGGHMNVHRKDRARLKQSPNHNSNPNSFPFQSPSLPNYHLPNPNLSPSLPNGGRLDSKVGKDEELRNSCSRVRDKHHVGIGDLDEGLNFGFGQSRLTSGLFNVDNDDDGREDAGTVTSCKRRKTDDETSSIQFFVKSSSLVENHHHHHIQQEVIGLSSTSLHDLDLELRLGGLSKG